jgi:hypothetical protein
MTTRMIDMVNEFAKPTCSQHVIATMGRIA